MKILSLNFGSIPMPLSWIEKHHSVPLSWNETCTLGCSAPWNLIALPIRFCITWIICDSSAKIVGRESWEIMAASAFIRTRGGLGFFRSILHVRRMKRLCLGIDSGELQEIVDEIPRSLAAVDGIVHVFFGRVIQLVTVLPLEKA